MKIGFLISGIGIYGSVREIVENGNVFTDLGHDVTIFNPEGESIDWIPFKGKVKFESKLEKTKLDVLIMTLSPNAYYLRLFEKAKATIKIFCFMGFDPSTDVLGQNASLRKIVDNYYLTADGLWQIDWIRNNTKSKKIIDAQIGGINLDMFRPLSKSKRTKLNIGWSGDMRKRKGGSTLIDYFNKRGMPTLTYFNQGIPQSEMAYWFNKIDIFIDNHYSGGWCNPVAEAMACGVPVICSDIECNLGFAFDEVTALKFKFNDVQKLDSNLNRMIYDTELRKFIAENALKKIKEFDYNIIAQNFLEKLNDCK